jgi:hypothetical protein
MQLNGLLLTLPKHIKLFIAVFVLVLSVGYFTGLLFVNSTSSAEPNGIEEHYLGNESDENAEVMKFKKSDKEMLSIVHSHILSMALIFFLLGSILSLTKLNLTLKKILMIEPFLSVILTFGGIYFLWKGVLWMKYIVMVSGTLMTLSYTLSAIIILYQIFFLKKNKA